MTKNTFPEEKKERRFSALRKEYAQKSLDIDEVDSDPLRQSERWIDEAAARGVVEPNAMVLATVSSAGAPSARAVLLKGLDERGLVFYSNAESRKGREIAANGSVALLFLWPELERQIRVEGTVEQVAAAESDRYFASRPRGAQLSAHVSQQSATVERRHVLEEKMVALEREFTGREIPRPAHWVGFRVVPKYFEFWQGRENRLHDRIVYSRDGAGWVLQRLQP